MQFIFTNEKDGSISSQRILVRRPLVNDDVQWSDVLRSRDGRQKRCDDVRSGSQVSVFRTVCGRAALSHFLSTALVLSSL